MPNGVVPDETAECGITGTSPSSAANGRTGHGAGLNFSSGTRKPSLPIDEDHEHGWVAAEKNWLQQIAIARAKEDRDIILEYSAQESILHAELDEAICEHNRLTEMQLQARVLVDEKKADIEWLVDQYRRQKKAVEDRRAADDLHMRAWINKGRKLIGARNHQPADRPVNGNSLLEADHQCESLASANKTQKGGSLPTNGSRLTTTTVANSPALSPATQYRHVPGLSAALSPTTAQVITALPRPATNGRSPGEPVSVVNGDGAVIGIVARIAPENHWIQALLDRAVVRNVEIRQGRKFTTSHLDAIYESHDQKRCKWLSFMIQATGKIQSRACQTCAKGQGLFSLCIIVGGSDFPRCGNCEWNKQGCHGASDRISNRVSVAKFDFEQQKGYPRLKINDYHGNDVQLELNRSIDMPLQYSAHADIDSDFSQHDSQSLMSINKRDLASQSHATSTPQQAGLSMMRQLSPPPNGGENDEITLAMIASKDDGVIFLEPDLMYGVPLRKISPDHAYWEPSWKQIEGAVQNKLEEWMDRLAKLKALPEASLVEKERTAVFQAGRQVNRGKATMRYLTTCDFHPYQLVAKKWITPALTHYDTLFRMVATLDELAKFRLDVTPLQWLRQRLYELYCENRSTFKLDRAIAKLYHDPKLAHLRSKNGFGNIGRPSAASRPRGNEANGIDSERDTAIEKRKGAPDSEASTPNKRFTAINKQPDKDDGSRPARKTVSRSVRVAIAGAATVTTNRRNVKRTPPASLNAKAQTAATSVAAISPTSSASSTFCLASLHVSDDAAVSAADSDLEYSGYTTSDSLTHDTVVKKDWRVYQIKTRSLATNPQTTQYWHWVDEKQANRSNSGGRHDYDSMFEHQVLKETEPVTGWGVFADPVDFHLRLHELTEVAFSPESDIIVISTREVEGIVYRGDIFARFKRERTKRRFLAFLQKKGVTLRRTERQAIEDEWYGITAEVMAGNESE
ncbi:MAG: hypothetical protein SEPTF4163_001485 [Sporothrix epigloea]